MGRRGWEWRGGMGEGHAGVREWAGQRTSVLLGTVSNSATALEGRARARWTGGRAELRWCECQGHIDCPSGF